MLEKFNRRITVKELSSNTPGEFGEVTTNEINSWLMWAKIEQRSGSPAIGQGQEIWNYDTKITLRYQKNRLIKSNMIVVYEGAQYKINNVAVKEEGFKEFVILRCSKTDGFIT